MKKRFEKIIITGSLILLTIILLVSGAAAAVTYVPGLNLKWERGLDSSVITVLDFDSYENRFYVSHNGTDIFVDSYHRNKQGLLERGNISVFDQGWACAVSTYMWVDSGKIYAANVTVVAREVPLPAVQGERDVEDARLSISLHQVGDRTIQVISCVQEYRTGTERDIYNHTWIVEQVDSMEP